MKEERAFRSIPFNVEEVLRGDPLNKKKKKINKMTFVIIQSNDVGTKNSGINSQATLSTKKSMKQSSK